MRRLLQHVLPKGLHKVRYFGLWHPVRGEHAARARLLLRRLSRSRAKCLATEKVAGTMRLP